MISTNILKGFRPRISWTTMKAILEMNNIPTGNGWDRTIRKLETNVSDNNIEANINHLKDIYNKHLFISEKAIQIYKLERKIIDTLIEQIKQYNPPSTPFLKTYPFPLSSEELRNINYVQEIVKIIDDEDSLKIILCTKRLHVERSPIDTDKLREETKKDLIEYEKVIGEKRYYIQFFDLIVLSKHKDLIEIRIDVGHNLSSEEIGEGFLKTKMRFNLLLDNLNTGIKNPLTDRINFFPLIDTLCESNEGKIVELGFLTDEGSIKNVKMKKGSVDLRKEKFHSAGKKAVDHINAFRLSVRWDYTFLDKINTDIELVIPGQATIFNNNVQYIEEIHIKKCFSLDQYNFIFQKVMNNLEL
ncbi:MAG: hypothetical protein AAFQ80_21375 [Cyanobacteria bacterium J06621_8]